MIGGVLVGDVGCVLSRGDVGGVLSSDHGGDLCRDVGEVGGVIGFCGMLLI